MTIIGSISAKITADDTEFLAAMDRTKRSLKSQASNLRSSGNDFAKWGAAAAAAAVAVGAAIFKSTADNIQQLKTFSQVANTSTQDFQKLAYAAKTTGIEEDKLADILKDVNDRLGDFKATGGGAMADFFNNIAPKVGVTYENFRKLSGKDALQLYVSSLEKANLSQQDMTFYMEAIASDSTQLLPLLKNNGQAFGEMAKEADALGLALSNVDIAKVEQANKELAKSSSIMGAAMQDATVSLAPVIAGISQQLNDAAKQAGGFGEVFDRVINVSASVLGVFADGIHGINVIIEGLKVAFWGVAHVVNMSFAKAGEGVDYFINTTKNNINSVIEGVNALGAEIPKLEIASSAATNFLKDQAAASQAALDAAINQFDELALKELPSQSIKKWLAEVRASADEAAKAVAAATTGSAGGESGSGGGTGLTSEQKKALQDKVEAIRQSNLSEVEALKEKFSLEAETLAMAYENKLIAEEEFQARMVEISQAYSDKKDKIAENSARNQQQILDAEQRAKLKGTKQMFGNLSGLMNTESRKLFEIGKGAAIANSIITGIESAIINFKEGSKIGGYPVGLAFAAASAATTFAQIQQIKSQSFSSGAGAGQTFSGGTPATPTTDGQGQGAGRSVQISLTGSSFGAGGIRDLIEEINEAVGDGVSLSTG